MALNHRQKVKVAGKMRTVIEFRHGVRLFDSLAWRQRKWQIQQRVARREARAKYYSEVRQGVR